MKISALLCLLPSLALAGLPSPEEEIAALKAEYAKREAVAVRPVKDWLADELAKKEKAFLAAGKSEAAAAAARERAAMWLCSTDWTWELSGDPCKLIFHSDGSGVHTALGSKFTWKVANWTVTLKMMKDDRTSVLTFDSSALKYEGLGFDKKRVIGKAIAK